MQTGSRRRAWSIAATCVSLAAFVGSTAACAGVEEPRWAPRTDSFSSPSAAFESPRRVFVIEADPAIGSVEFTGVVRDRAPHKVIAPTPGRVLEVFVELGDEVRASDHVLTFLPDPTEAELIELEIAQLRIDAAVASQAADGEIAQRQAEYDRLQASFELRTEVVRAGSAGIVSGTRSNVRYRVAAEATLFEVADPSDVVVEVTAAPDDLRLLVSDSRITATANSESVGPTLSGRVLEAPRGDRGRTQIQIELDDPAAVMLGDRLVVAVPVDIDLSTQWIPIEAVGRAGGSSYVLVADADDRLRRLDIALGRRTQTHVQVRSGLDVGTRLVAPQ